MADRSNLLFSLLFLVASSLATVSLSEDVDCVYSFFIRTGSIFKAGTDSKIGVTLSDKYGNYLQIRNLEAWGGVMGPYYNYFERGNLDIFTGRAPCLAAAPCAMNLTSDGSGDHHGWYCNYVEVTITGVHRGCAQKQFEVEQWLALDAPPYELTATRNLCNGESAGKETFGPRNRKALPSVLSSVV